MAGCLCRVKCLLKILLGVFLFYLLIFGQDDTSIPVVRILGKNAGAQHHSLARRFVLPEMLSKNYILDASEILHYISPVSSVAWRHFNPGISCYNGSIYYVGHLGKLIRENQNDNSATHWNRVNKLFFAKLKRQRAQGKMIFHRVQIKFDPFERIKQSRMEGVKIVDPPEFRSNADCELTFDGSDGGHGYKEPRLIVWKKQLHLVFSSREQVFNKSQCVGARNFYICKIQIDLDSWDSDVPKPVTCTDPIKLILTTQIDKINYPRQVLMNDWRPFVSKERLYFSTEFHPEHVVIDCTELASTGQNTCVEMYKSKSERVFQMALNFMSTSLSKPGTEINLDMVGGTSAVLVSSFIKRFPDVFVGAILTGVMDDTRNKSCFNLLYKMEAEPPFPILSVRPLKLQNSMSEKFYNLSNDGPIFYRNFYPASYKCASVSDLSTVDGQWGSKTTLLLAYGVSDAETRIQEIIV